MSDESGFLVQVPGLSSVPCLLSSRDDLSHGFSCTSPERPKTDLIRAKYANYKKHHEPHPIIAFI